MSRIHRAPAPLSSPRPVTACAVWLLLRSTTPLIFDTGGNCFARLTQRHQGHSGRLNLCFAAEGDCRAACSRSMLQQAACHSACRWLTDHIRRPVACSDGLKRQGRLEKGGSLLECQACARQPCEQTDHSAPSSRLLVSETVPCLVEHQPRLAFLVPGSRCFAAVVCFAPAAQGEGAKILEGTPSGAGCTASWR